MDAHAATLPPPAMPATGLGRLADRLDRAVGTVVEFVAAVLVLAEIVILVRGRGGALRAAHAPLVWSDELASILFLWLCDARRSVVALRRGEHMRMTGLGQQASDRRHWAYARSARRDLRRARVPGDDRARMHYEYAYEDERFITTPALEIANSWRAAALPIGIVLMLFAASAGCCASAPGRPSLWRSGSRWRSSFCSGCSARC
jgi:TRAP-type C4-dicarboxylate transport system permease small subunit